MADAAEEGSVEESRSQFRDMNKTAFLVGYTGGAGKALLMQLVEANLFKKLLLLGRRKIDLPEGDKYANVEQRVINFDQLEENLSDFTGCDVGYCCLGVPAQHPKDEYYRVNFEYIVNTAKTAKSAGCGEFYLLSGQGAHHQSSFYHMRTKGKAEEAVKACGFERCSIFRPSLIDIKREQKRTMEEVLKVLTKPFKWFAGSKFYISAETLAKGIVYDSVRMPEVKFNLYENADIHKLADGKNPFEKKK